VDSARESADGGRGRDRPRARDCDHDRDRDRDRVRDRARGWVRRRIRPPRPRPWSDSDTESDSDSDSDPLLRARGAALVVPLGSGMGRVSARSPAIRSSQVAVPPPVRRSQPFSAGLSARSLSRYPIGQCSTTFPPSTLSKRPSTGAQRPGPTSFAGLDLPVKCVYAGVHNALPYFYSTWIRSLDFE
jgi:hypothetical protein